MPTILDQIQELINKASEQGDPKICYLGPKAYKEAFGEFMSKASNVTINQVTPVFNGVKVLINQFYLDDVITVADRTFEESNYKVLIASHIKGLPE